MTDTCDRCGATLHLGEWPYCPHGFPARPGGVAMIDDQLTGGARFIENLGPQPVWVETKSQLRAELAARGLMPKVQHVSGRESDKSAHTSRWI